MNYTGATFMMLLLASIAFEVLAFGHVVALGHGLLFLWFSQYPTANTCY